MPSEVIEKSTKKAIFDFVEASALFTFIYCTTKHFFTHSHSNVHKKWTFYIPFPFLNMLCIFMLQK